MDGICSYMGWFIVCVRCLVCALRNMAAAGRGMSSKTAGRGKNINIKIRSEF